MRPDEARDLLQAAEDDPRWIADYGPLALSALAADTLEYRIEHQHIENGYWHPITKWSPEWPLNDGHSVAPDERIVCRRVSPEWVVTDE